MNKKLYLLTAIIMLFVMSIGTQQVVTCFECGAGCGDSINYHFRTFCRRKWRSTRVRMAPDRHNKQHNNGGQQI